MEPDRSPAQLIADSDGLLLDFDGPVCDVYAGRDPARIAREVATAFELEVDTDGPLDLITHALATDGPVDGIHQALTETEIEAIRTATETPGIRQLVQGYHGPVAIVSNNASEAIENWVATFALQCHIEAVIGRDPRHMKPDPRALRLSGEATNRQLGQCVFVGDSLSDALAANRAGTLLIALANKPNKVQLFMDEGLSAIITGIDELLPST